MKRFFTVVLSAFLCLSASAQINVFEGSLADGLKKAKKEKKDLMVMVSTTWCGPCKAFAKEMIPSKEVGDYVNPKYVFMHFDVDKEDPNSIQDTYGIAAYPTFLILDGKGAELGRFVGGSRTVEQFAQKEQAALNSPLSAAKKAFKEDPVANLDKYVAALKAEYRMEDAYEAYSVVFDKMGPEEFFKNYSRSVSDVIRYVNVNYEDKIMKYLLDNPESSKEWFGDSYHPVVAGPISSITFNAYMGKNEKDVADAWKTLDGTYAQYPILKNFFSDFTLENRALVEAKDVNSLLNQILISPAKGGELFYPFYAVVEMAKKMDFETFKPRLVEVARMLGGKDPEQQFLYVVDRDLAAKEAKKEEKPAPKRIAEGEQCPEFTYKDYTGKEYHLSDFAGKYIVFDFWATWCGPCCYELPYLEQVEKEFEGNDKVVFVSVSIDKEEGKNTYATWEKAVHDGGFTKGDNEYHLGGIQLNESGDKSLTEAFRITGIPRFLIIGPDGKVVTADAPRPSKGMAEMLKELLK
ncbi:MAG: redoxin family protein [Bacteroidales bacterium]|nr:redoxin family protein [Bacteroidales bacterium]